MLRSGRLRRLVVVAAGALVAASVGSSVPVLALSDGSQSTEIAVEQAEIDSGSGFGVKSSVVAGVSGNFASVLAPKTTGIFDRSATFGTGVTPQVSAGVGHTCALLNTGVVNCWGNNDFGQLGNNSIAESLVPVAVGPFTVGSASAVSIAAGRDHTCAVLDTGVVNCWGQNSKGQLGNDSTADSLVPVAVDAFTDGATAVSIAASHDHTCAVLNTGAVNCWGNNEFGQLGNNSTDDSLVPVAVDPFTVGSASAVAIAVGSEHTCAVLDTGVVNCWGYNHKGQLGNNSTDDSLVPVAVDPFTGGVTAVSIAADLHHTCAVLNTGVVNCWGNNDYGQLGNNSTDDSLVPVAVDPFTDGATAVSIAAGYRQVCAVLDTGVVNCWGDNFYGQLGDSTTADSLEPVAVATFTDGATAVAIAVGDFHTCAVLNTGAVNCWGYGGEGQLGNNSTADSLVPVAVDPFTVGSASAGLIAAGVDHTCALLNTGVVNCWGDNADGQLGNNSRTDSLVPVAVDAFTDGASAVSIAAGDLHTCAVLDTGVVNCWGYNADGQLGNDSTTESLVPVAVNAFIDGSTAVSIAAGAYHTCAVLNTGVVNCWGFNGFGQLGNDSTAESLVPVAVDDFTVGSASAVSITVGADHTCAALDTGVVNCWGDNADGQLGNDSTTESLVPVAVDAFIDGSTAVSIAAGDYHTCAVLNTGVVNCWGDNADGQLGNNSTADSSVPVGVDPFTVGSASAGLIAAGVDHTCALLNTGVVNCWGDNADGQLGNNSRTDSLVPVAVDAFTDGASAVSIAAGRDHTCALLNTGVVNCWGKNNFGQLGNNSTETSSVPVKVTSVTVPGVPTAVSATAGNGQATVVWTAPVSDGGSEISGYTVTSSPDNKTCTTTGALTCTVTGLTNATAYTFTVTATNAAGDSPASTESGAVTPVASVTVPGVPTAVSATAGNGQATVVWTAPVSDGGSEISGYTVTSSPDNKTCTTTGALTCTVTGLTNATAYTFTVTATNAAGDSPASTESGAVTPVASVTVPGVPTAVSATAGNGQATVVWTAPVSDGGSEISGYTVTSSPDNKTCTTTGALTCTVAGLTNATAYTFTVTATNAAGDSPASTESGAVTPVASLVALTPGRLLETRSGPNDLTVDGFFQGNGRRDAGTTLELTVTGRGGVPNNAGAVVLNVTAVSPSAPGHLTVFPCGTDVPLTSTLNYGPGEVVANAAVTKIGTDGKVCINTHAASDIVVDVTGYIPAGSLFSTVVPGRLLDTRSGPNDLTIDGFFQGNGRRDAGTTLELTVTGRGGVLNNAGAVVLNVTAVSPSAPGHLTVFPCGTDVPLTSTLNYGPGEVVANAAVTKIGTDGKVCINTHAASDIVVDVTGYIPAGSLFSTVVPGRLLDTRSGPNDLTIDGFFQGNGRRDAGTTLELTVTGRGGVPNNAGAVVLNVTAVSPSAPGHLTVFPCGTDVPLTSTLNYGPGEVVANAAVTKIGTDGKVCINTHAASDIVVDVTGYISAG